jgi:hypothetical protein
MLIERGGIVLRIVRPSSDELTAHEARLASIERASDGRCLWRRLERA